MCPRILIRNYRVYSSALWFALPYTCTLLRLDAVASVVARSLSSSASFSCAKSRARRRTPFTNSAEVSSRGTFLTWYPCSALRVRGKRSETGRSYLLCVALHPLVQTRELLGGDVC